VALTDQFAVNLGRFPRESADVIFWDATVKKIIL
jgi:hypothetical protein